MKRTSFLFICQFFVGSVIAQSLYNQSVISIGPSSVVYVKDTIVNRGTIINHGDMQIGGSWINQSQYDAADGQITFNSDLPQIINHNDQSFSRLTITGGGRKLILADVTIEDEIVLDDGVIENENNARVIIDASAMIIGGSDQSHINAPVYHQGNGEKLYPLGNGSIYLPVRVLEIGDASAFVGVEGIELHGNSLAKAPSLDAISTTRYWHVDVVSGSINSRLELPVRDENLGGSFDDIVVAESDVLTDQFLSAGKSSAEGTFSNGMVTSERTIASRFVTLASASDNGLPVVYNAVSSNGDGLNDFLTISNIQFHPENKFTLFNRWGDKIFEIENYDNDQRVFRGKSNVNGEKEIVNGTYFYSLETETGIKLNGFLVLKN